MDTALAVMIQSELGGAPASGAADDALVVGFRVRLCELFRSSAARRVRREGASNPDGHRDCAPPFVSTASFRFGVRLAKNNPAARD
jgi:hypothetical protein